VWRENQKIYLKSRADTGRVSMSFPYFGKFHENIFTNLGLGNKDSKQFTFVVIRLIIHGIGNVKPDRFPVIESRNASFSH